MVKKLIISLLVILMSAGSASIYAKEIAAEDLAALEAAHVARQTNVLDRLLTNALINSGINYSDQIRRHLDDSIDYNAIGQGGVPIGHKLVMLPGDQCQLVELALRGGLEPDLLNNPFVATPLSLAIATNNCCTAARLYVAGASIERARNHGIQRLEVGDRSLLDKINRFEGQVRFFPR